MKKINVIFHLFLGLIVSVVKSQDVKPTSPSLLKSAEGVDSLYVKTYTLPNDCRVIIGGQGSNIGFQSNRDKSLKLDIKNYNNVNDLYGFGLTYKFIDFDILTSLNSAVLLPDGSNNLIQFRLSTSYTGRKNSFRVYYSDYKGMISSDPQANYRSESDIHMFKLGTQITHIFNSNKFSYRAANFQSELQMLTAGSLLLRIEPFYRELGMNNAVISSTSRNVTSIFEDVAGLSYVSSPGIVAMPGYAINLVMAGGKLYTCPMILFGPGFSYNKYTGDLGKFESFNLEINSSLMINSGFNGKRMYLNLRASADFCYSYFDPSLLSTTEIKIYLTYGFRFRNLENKLPISFL